MIYHCLNPDSLLMYVPFILVQRIDNINNLIYVKYYLKKNNYLLIVNKIN